MQRLREIEDEIEEHERALEEAWTELARRHEGDPGTFSQLWPRRARRWSFHAVNELIDRHNEYYPTEARLPMDPRTGDFVFVGAAPYRRRRLDAAWVLERFPADLTDQAAA